MSAAFDELTEGFREVPNRTVKYGPRGHLERETDFSRDKETRNVQSDLPAIEELPPPIREMVEYLQNDELTDLDKMNFIQDMITSNIRSGYLMPEEDMPLRGDDLKDITNWEVGDCDNHAQLVAAMLKYSGFEEENMAVLGVNSINYGDSEFNGGHAVLLLEHEGQIYLFDLNVDDVIALDENLEGTNSAGSSVSIDKDDIVVVYFVEKGQETLYHPDRAEDLKETTAASNNYDSVSSPMPS